MREPRAPCTGQPSLLSPTTRVPALCARRPPAAAPIAGDWHHQRQHLDARLRQRLHPGRLPAHGGASGEAGWDADLGGRRPHRPRHRVQGEPTAHLGVSARLGPSRLTSAHGLTVAHLGSARLGSSRLISARLGPSRLVDRLVGASKVPDATLVERICGRLIHPASGERHFRDTSETRARHGRDTAEAVPRHSRSTAKTHPRRAPSETRRESWWHPRRR